MQIIIKKRNWMTNSCRKAVLFSLVDIYTLLAMFCVITQKMKGTMSTPYEIYKLRMRLNSTLYNIYNIQYKRIQAVQLVCLEFISDVKLIENNSHSFIILCTGRVIGDRGLHHYFKKSKYFPCEKPLWMEFSS